jgi:hypothetical protein
LILDLAARGVESRRHSGRPSFFLVGAPKAGTTAMNSYLLRHPEVFMATKELHYFCDDLFNPPLHKRDLAWYLTQFSKAGEKRLLGEASVFYLSSDHAAERIKEFEPRAKILIHVRNPADLLVSYHSEMLFHGYEDIEDIEEALEAEGPRRKGRNIPAGCPVPRMLNYSEITRLTSQIEHFLAIFDRENVLINIFDDLVANPSDTYRRTLAFLGADTSFTTTFEIINSNKITRSRLLGSFLRNTPLSVRQAARRVLSQPVREALRRTLWRINTRFIPRLAPKPEVLSNLKGRFAGEVEQLSKLLGRDLTAWSR